MIFSIILLLLSYGHFNHANLVRQIQPPIVRPKGLYSCSAELIKPSNLSSWSEVIVQPLALPVECLSSERKWSKIILDVEATSEGTQFDRFGAMWIGEIEVIFKITKEDLES